MKTIRENEAGASAVEFAIVLPLLVVILFGIVEFSTMLYNKAVLTNASREAARLGILFKSGERDPASEDAEIISAINTYTASSLVTFGPEQNVATSIAREGFEAGNPLTVSVSYQYDFLILPEIVTSLSGPLNISATTIMRME